MKTPSRASCYATLALWGLALGGYFAPWVGQRAAALAWNAYDLFDLLRRLPEIETGALRVNPYALRLPLLGLGVLLPLLLAGAQPAPRRSATRWGAALVGAGLVVGTFPPYPEILTAWRTPGWNTPFWGGIGGLAGCAIVAALAPRLGRARPWLLLGWSALSAIPALVTFDRLRPALETLFAGPVSGGWGLWLYTVALGLLALSLWAGTLTRKEPGDELSR